MNQQTIAVISGGASGLGLATAQKVIQKDGKVAILDINEEQGQQACRELGSNAIFVKTDIASENDVNQAIEKTLSHWGAINLAVGCAGVLGAGKVLGKEGPMSGDYFQRVVNINLVGSFLLTKAAAHAMTKNSRNAQGETGVIIHTASIAAYEGQYGQSAYAATKAGIVGMILPMAREFARHGIRIMAIAPGMFETPMMKDVPDTIRSQLLEGVPFPSRFGQPSEYADMVAQVVENPMLNGSTIRLDAATRLQ
ncbi:MAG: SDR family NAD(P)-dependent oxidoreductase [Pseudomonadota bacterium]